MTIEQQVKKVVEEYLFEGWAAVKMIIDDWFANEADRAFAAKYFEELSRAINEE